MLQCVAVCGSELQCVAVCCSVLQCVAVCCSVLQCVAVCCSVLQCVAVSCSVLQCVAVRCSVRACTCVCESRTSEFYECVRVKRIFLFFSQKHTDVCLCLLRCLRVSHAHTVSVVVWYGVAMVSRIDKITGFFCKRAL